MPIDIRDLTLGQLEEIQAMGLLGNKVVNPQTSVENNPFKIGACYLIRTVTMIQTGRLVEVTPTELVLEEAAWIADTGRFSTALKSLEFNDVEPFPDGRVIVGRGALIDAVEISKTVRECK